MPKLITSTVRGLAEGHTASDRSNTEQNVLFVGTPAASVIESPSTAMRSVLGGFCLLCSRSCKPSLLKRTICLLSQSSPPVFGAPVQPGDSSKAGKYDIENRSPPKRRAISESANAAMLPAT